MLHNKARGIRFFDKKLKYNLKFYKKAIYIWEIMVYNTYKYFK
jgi:hypothetical protein